MTSVNSPSPRKQARGFTLAELAIAFFIIGLLLAGAFMPLASQVEGRNIADTKRSMDQIRDALIGFAQANGRLPCPANGTLVSGAVGAGQELYVGTACTKLIGVIPWATLGVPETDAWGRRFTYRVASVFSDAISVNTYNTTGQNTGYTGAIDCLTPLPTPASSSFALCSLGEIAVIKRVVDPATLAHSTSSLGTGLPAVVISHGRNGYGAFQISGKTLLPIPASGTDEYANIQAYLDSELITITPTTPGSGYNFNSYLFYSRDQTPESSNCSETSTGSRLCEFDDIVLMISAPTLVSRMVSAGRLP